MKKIIIGCVIYTFLVIVILPLAFTSLIKPKSTQVYEDVKKKEEYAADLINVVNPETNEIIQSPFEDYIKGVVAAEMPAGFEPEALKAQAVAARTYAYRKIITEGVNEADNSLYNIGQAYITVDEMKENWGINFDQYFSKISDAVDSTCGEIMTYNDEPILAVFHSTSSGMTENAKNVWGSDVEYLQSVDSGFDINAPEYESSVTIPANTVIAKLQQWDSSIVFTQARLLDQIQIIERSSAGYVLKMQVGNKIITGKQFREILGLRSADFSITQNDENMVFITKGYGHGAGMSQYGANFMAEEGYDYKYILNHYYQNVEIVQMK